MSCRDAPCERGLAAMRRPDGEWPRKVCSLTPIRGHSPLHVFRGPRFPGFPRNFRLPEVLDINKIGRNEPVVPLRRAESAVSGELPVGTHLAL